MFFVLGLLVIVALFKLGGGQRTVLVLAGGGAKGAWTVGVLKGLCKKDAYKDTWDTLSGTSIGAMNAGMLAQFPREQQCSHAVPELEKYWDSIQSVGDVWKRTDIPGRWDGFGDPYPCLHASNLFSAGYGFYNYGGICDPSPGSERYKKFVDAAKIRNSGMRLLVTASSLRTGKPTVFTQSSEQIVDGCIASGSIAPIVYPKRIGQDLYVDGAVFHNAPLLAALDITVKRAIVVLLGPLADASTPVELFVNDSNTRPTISGTEVVQFYLEAIFATITERKELRDACTFFPNTIIEAVIPKESFGSLVDFSPEAIASLKRSGIDFIDQGLGPVDACSFLGVSKRHRMMRYLLGFDPIESWLPNGKPASAFIGNFGNSASYASHGSSILTMALVSVISFIAGRATVTRHGNSRYKSIGQVRSSQ